MMNRNYQQLLEQQTGLILANAENQAMSNNENLLQDDRPPNTTSPIITCTATIEALRALRDSNPSLLNKLNTKATELQISDDCACLDYWISIQEIVTLHGGKDDNYCSLKCLNLGGLMVRIKTMLPFMEALKKSKLKHNLEVLNLGGTDIFLSNLLQAVKGDNNNCNSNDGYEKKNNGNREAKYDNVSSNVDLLSSLQKLYLSGCGISYQRNGLETLSSILKYMPNLTTLDLRYNDLQKSKPRNQNNDREGEKEDINKSLKDFFEKCISQSNIEVLHLEGNNLNDDVMAALGNAFANPNIKLRELYLGSNRIGAKGSEFIANGLKSNQTVEKIYLEGNFIGDEGVKHFCLLLEGKKQHKSLINKNDEIESVIDNVLEKLWVENNGAGKDMMKRLGIAIQSNNVVIDL